MSKVGRRMSLLAVVASLFAVSCSTTESDGFGDSRAISFIPNPATRAVVAEDANGMDAFSVWGWCSKDLSTSQIFTGKRVYKAGGNWTYEGIQYWLPDYTYGFYAVYPEFPAAGAEGQTTAASVADDGTITVTGFDCSKTGTEAVDLMTASNSGISYAAGVIPQPVTLKFGHELSRLKFTVKSENAVDTIKSFKVYGVNYKGDLSKGTTTTWNPNPACTAENTPFYMAEPFTFNTTNGWEKDMLGDVLLIPDADLTDAKLEIVHRYQGEKADRTSVVSLNTVKTPQWEAGKSYHYSLTIKGGTLTINVTVADWKEENTSVSWG